jgi:hypothetical protein
LVAKRTASISSATPLSQRAPGGGRSGPSAFCLVGLRSESAARRAHHERCAPFGPSLLVADRGQTDTGHDLGQQCVELPALDSGQQDEHHDGESKHRQRLGRELQAA